MTADKVFREVRVAILEDVKSTRIGLELLLKDGEEISIVGSVQDAKTFLECVHENKPDVVFVDLKVQGAVQTGISAIKELKQISPKTKCIVVTAFPTPQVFLEVLNLGVEAFICKDAETGENPSFVELTRMVMRGRRHYDATIVSELGGVISSSQLVPDLKKHQEDPNPLSSREQEVLAELAKGCSNQELAQHLSIEVNTVKAHVRSILAKLEAKNRDQAVLIARARGWL